MMGAKWPVHGLGSALGCEAELGFWNLGLSCFQQRAPLVDCLAVGVLRSIRPVHTALDQNLSLQLQAQP